MSKNSENFSTSKINGVGVVTLVDMGEYYDAQTSEGQSLGTIDKNYVDCDITDTKILTAYIEDLLDNGTLEVIEMDEDFYNEDWE